MWEMENMKQTDIWWTVAAVSSFCTTIYGFFLIGKLTAELDYSDFYNYKDQLTYIEFTQEDSKYKSFLDATTETTDRRLTGYEIDQLFEALGPIQIGKYVQQIQDGQSHEEQIKQVQAELNKTNNEQQKMIKKRWL